MFPAPLAAWIAAFLLLSPQHIAGDPTCAQLAAHLGARQVHRMNASRADGALRVGEVCVKVAVEARRQGLDPAIAVAIAYGESRLRWRVPGKRYLGPMQVGRRWCKVPEEQCVPDGVRHLLRWRKRSDSWDDALWGYVGGHARGLSARALKRKRRYVARVKEMVEAISADPYQPPTPAPWPRRDDAPDEVSDEVSEDDTNPALELRTLER